MNVTFPDNATIQIFVVPPGGSAAVDPETGTPRVLLAAPVRKPSRRRDVLFVGAGIALAIGVLSVVRFAAEPDACGAAACNALPTRRLDPKPTQHSRDLHPSQCPLLSAPLPSVPTTRPPAQTSIQERP